MMAHCLRYSNSVLSTDLAVYCATSALAFADLSQQFQQCNDAKLELVVAALPGGKH